MRKIIAMLLAIAIMCSSMPAVSFAYDEKVHDAFLEQVLFGKEECSTSQKEEIKNKIRMLEYASYLAIDQSGSRGEDKLNFLQSEKVKNLPKLSEFDLTGIFYGEHRNYTHRGWDYTYQVPKDETHDKANWPVRKDLLRSTVNKVFDFGIWNEWFGNYCAQCDSFSALIYYVHMLGDHLGAESYKASDLSIPLARASAGDSNPDIFWELKAHCEVLFSTQKKSNIYIEFFQKIESLAGDARALAGSEGGINTDEKFREYQDYANELMEILTAYVPLLLKNEPFFNTEFNDK